MFLLLTDHAVQMKRDTLQTNLIQSKRIFLKIFLKIKNQNSTCQMECQLPNSKTLLSLVVVLPFGGVVYLVCTLVGIVEESQTQRG